MTSWTLAAVQFDCKLGEPATNLATMRRLLNDAADRGANLIAFPELALTGYGFPDRPSVERVAETIPGPATDAIAEECRKRNVFAVFGLIESAGEKRFNAAAIVGPNGLVGGYRKIHMPCVGVDRFLDPGDRPFAVHDLGGLKLGVGICFDASFPESIRAMTLMGADVVVLPTNWADMALRNATLVTRVRALENHIYYVAVNRTGHETGYHYFGQSSICSFTGDFLAYADTDQEAIIVAPVDPVAARQKKVIICAGEYEIDRVNWRRPEMYGPLTSTSHR
ncbi:MAG: carbon-nitrogen hydrolase family protein [Gemmataceae bacterium]